MSRRILLAACVVAIAALVGVSNAAVVPLRRDHERYSRRHRHHPSHEAAVADHAAFAAAFGSPLVDVFVNDTIDVNGWIGLKIRKSGNASHVPHDHGAVWYAAGYAEGFALQKRIRQHWINTVQPTPDSVLAPEVEAWLHAHLNFMQGNVARFNQTDAWWKYVGLLLVQISGLTDGYNAALSGSNATNETMTFFDMFVFNFQFELGDVATATSASAPAKSFKYVKGGCTVYVKPTADDLYFSHTTWTEYPTMLRVFRDIDLGDLRIAFTGYPGLIASNDDWYMLSSNLTVAETTELIWKNDLFRDFTIPESVSEFLRVMVAHHVAVDGNSWVNAFRRYNSGTYNNMYMVLDYNKYVPGTPAAQLEDDLLWIVEQLPGVAPIGDVTPMLRKDGYWGSYNRAYYELVFNVSGMREMVARDGEYFLYSQSPRAQIMRYLDGRGVSTLADIQHLLRYNEWQNSSMSVCPGCKNPTTNPMYSIGARGDLVPHAADTDLGVLRDTGLIGPTMAMGATDAKIDHLLPPADGQLQCEHH